MQLSWQFLQQGCTYDYSRWMLIDFSCRCYFASVILISLRKKSIISQGTVLGEGGGEREEERAKAVLSIR